MWQGQQNQHQPYYPPGFQQQQQPYNPAYPHQQAPAIYNPQQPPYMDPEYPDAKGFEFDDASIRRGFIRKVYSILTVQLSITLAVISLFVFHKPTNGFIKQHHEIVWISLGVVVVTMIALACCESVRRKSPMNIIFLGIFTIAESVMMGCMSVRYSADLVMMAVGITAAVCLGLTLFAFQTKFDFTVCGGALFVAVIIMVIFGFVAMFFRSKTLTLVQASLGAMLFCVYLIYDTQLMLGGKHKYSISPEEYIFAALNLYLDIIQIFMYILTILGATRD
ncbi:CLUMA_CG008720, isoform A [Clunio marinus]|uniref:CLUMA_CG008720, isoform A n=1 Tax=Clunio marinus TaxID=568069 RepID=A0A1J1IAG0_9DIPT|nr:CLUMA_CG008720, isoform A [Clunio marinus]